MHSNDASSCIERRAAKGDRQVELQSDHDSIVGAEPVVSPDENGGVRIVSGSSRRRREKTLRVCLMIEGQEDVTWPQWCRLADACEQAGLEGLFRSDHYLSVQGRVERGSLDAWTTLAGLAARTERIRLGTMVSPATFRHPSVTAKSVVTVDHISGGRAELGLGAGWHEMEHRAYGFPFPDVTSRMQMLAEQLEIVRRQWGSEAFDFAGEHFRLEALDARPKPVQQPHPNLIVGGSGGRRSVALAARWADEYNTVFQSPDRCREIKCRVMQAWDQAGRDSGTLTFSLMTGCIVGADRTELHRRAQALMDWSLASGSVEEYLRSVSGEWVVGTVDEVRDRLGELADAGVDRIMLQDQLHEDIDMVHLLGAELVSAV
jgi:F420-dependent oxidoreductase-like protein